MMQLVEIFLIKEFLQLLKYKIWLKYNNVWINSNNEKVKDLETKITRGATVLLEINKFINDQLKVITTTLDTLNKKDTLTDD